MLEKHNICSRPRPNSRSAMIVDIETAAIFPTHAVIDEHILFLARFHSCSPYSHRPSFANRSGQRTSMLLITRYDV